MGTDRPQDTHTTGRKQFEEEVFPAEFIEIALRRKEVADGQEDYLSILKADLDEVEAALQAADELHQAEKTLKQAVLRETLLRRVLRWVRGPMTRVLKSGSDTAVEMAQERARDCGKRFKGALARLAGKVKPSTDLGLVGLAFSGGGIRSATFNLGLLQVLAKRGILKYVDYLSTVSGGGYIGSCVSSLLNDPDSGPNEKEFPLRHTPGEDETSAVKHLRNFGNYLAPGDLLDKIRIPALLLRGILINFLVVLPYLVLAVWLTSVSPWADQLREADGRRIDQSLADQRQVGIRITGQSLVNLRSEGLPDDVLEGLQGMRDRKYAGERELLPALTDTIGQEQTGQYGAFILKHSQGIPIEVVDQVQKIKNQRYEDKEQLLFTDEKQLMKDLTAAIGQERADRFGPLAIRQIKQAPLDWKRFYKVTPWAGFVLLVLIGLSPLLRWLIQRALSLLGKEFDWRWRNGYEISFGGVLLIVILIALFESLPTALMWLKPYWWEGGAGEEWVWGTAITSLLPYLFAHKLPAAISKWSGKLALVLLGLLGPLIFLLIYFRLCYWNIFYHPWGYFGLGWEWVYGAAGLIWLLTRFVDVNLTSLHGFYRDRLSKAYLFQPLSSGSQKEVASNDGQELSRLNGGGTRAPYHLINTTLNLQSSKDPNLRGRDADFFVLSKQYSGSERTGYCRTDVLENLDPHLNLGTAMAISGAAAAPNMGTTTIKPLVFIMTMLNIRLGYWLRNPYIVRKYWYQSGSAGNKQPGVESKSLILKVVELFWSVYRIIHRNIVVSKAGPIYLFKEFISKIDEKSWNVNLSDGGHIENLAVYELLRRRCTFIIACDAEQDAGMTFGGLATLIRYARIDMGIDIEMELDDVRRDADGLSRKHSALGKIRYGNGETGYLLYIKSSLTGDEDEDVREYRASHPAFPHESTADQFFDETQFEAYRALAYHIVDGLFHVRSRQEGEKEQELQVENWFRNLGVHLRPRPQMEETFIQLQEQLGRIERQFLDPAMAPYTYQIYPELRPDHDIDEFAIEAGAFPFAKYREDDERWRKIFHVCSQQMQLMENIYIALELDNPLYRDHYFNRGWMNLFRRWAQAPFFRWTWAVSIGIYSVGFQMFCQEALNLRSQIRWRRGGREELTRREREYLQRQEKACPSRFNAGAMTAIGQRRIQQDQIWIAEMSIHLIRSHRGVSFPIGFVTIRFSPGAPEERGQKDYLADLMFYRIQDYYRQMRLLEKMVPSLPRALAAETASYRLTGESLKGLEARGVPADMLSKLEGIKDQEIQGKESFLRECRQVLGDRHADAFERLMIKCAAKDEPWPKLRVNFSKDRDRERLRYRYFFERHGLEVVRGA